MQLEMMTKREETLALFCVGEEKSIRCRKRRDCPVERSTERRWLVRAEHTHVPSEFPGIEPVGDALTFGTLFC